MTVLDCKSVVDDRPDCGVFRNVCEFHLLAVPFEFHVQILKTDSKYTHYNHLVERTGFAEV